ncbi:hypothetical protein J6X96_08420 [bacterium]|nr:hypothetical protein [bacterium]
MNKHAFLVFLFLIGFLTLSSGGEEQSFDFSLNDKDYALMIERLRLYCSEDAREELDKKLRYGKDLKDTYEFARMKAFPLMEREIEQRKALLGKEKIKLLSYKEIDDNVKYSWSDFYLQRKNKGLSVEKTINALNKVEELKARLNDDNDPLTDINDYRDLHLLPGMSGQLYQLAEKIFWRGEYKKAYHCMYFFLLPENTDGFSIGAAHYYIGNLWVNCCDHFGHRKSRETVLEALRHYLKTPLYPTCLTYIAYSYFKAADMAYRLRDYRTSYALASMDVPCVDHDHASAKSHYFAALASFELKRYTNCILHAQEVQRRDPRIGIEEFLEILPYYDKESLWNYCATNKLPETDRYCAIVDALTNETVCVELDELYDVLTIEWPKVAELPENARTNRVLNNNFFKRTQNKQMTRYRQRKSEE